MLSYHMYIGYTDYLLFIPTLMVFQFANIAALKYSVVEVAKFLPIGTNNIHMNKFQRIFGIAGTHTFFRFETQ